MNINGRHAGGWTMILFVVSLVISGFPTNGVTVEPSRPGIDRIVRQDGRFIEKLRWTSPRGEMPGTYREYLARRPAIPGRFRELRPPEIRPNAILPPPGVREEREQEYIFRRHEAVPYAMSTISILIDEELYPSIAGALDQYRQDLNQERYWVRMSTVSGGTPEEIKAWIQSEYDLGSRGVVFIGDITAAWLEVSGDVFPGDLFYMDLDGGWRDNDADGDYETHVYGPEMAPDIYVSRVHAATLNYDTEANLVNDYFDKVRIFREGGMSLPWRGLEYVDEDWYDMDVNLDLIYVNDVVRHDFGFFTTALDYLDQMALEQHFVQVCAHSYSGGHHFGMRPTESVVYAHIYVHSPAARAADLLLGSDDGIKVWLNGNEVCTHDVYQGWSADQFTHPVTLDEGWNSLLCKVSQGGGNYEFSARLSDPSGENFEDLQYRVVDPMADGGEFIYSWILNGFHPDDSGNFWDYLTTNYLEVPEETLNPEEGDENGGQIWTANNSFGPFIDLDSYSGGENFGVCYAFTRIYSETDKSCQLWMGYDEGARVWLNGSEVLYDNRNGTYVQDMTRFDVDLIAGENRLLVKVSEWVNNHGFGARFCHSDGSRVSDLTYELFLAPVDYIDTWLMNGPYTNSDQATRLTTDYLGGEANVRPDLDDPAPFGTWEMAIGSGCPFDLATYYDRDGGWVFSGDVQDHDPPVWFYNLFACGPGRFTDTNYLAGAYIFNTTYGLIAVASSKSGSMLNFQDFTRPLGEGKTIGRSFREWFEDQSPYVLWEQEWYYGMILNGDPTLRVTE